MTIKDANEFWQAVETVGYMIEDENRAYERKYIKLLGKELDEYLKAHPGIKYGPEDGPEAPLEHFAMLAVARLANALNFNDANGSDRPGLGLIQASIALDNPLAKVLGLTETPVDNKDENNC
jgi:hypothetical protein